jgi:hypothetical protein
MPHYWLISRRSIFLFYPNLDVILSIILYVGLRAKLEDDDIKKKGEINYSSTSSVVTQIQ